MKKTIHDDGKIRAVWHCPEEIKYQNIIVITFQTINGSLSDYGFATKFLNSHGIENICFSHGGMLSYQNLSLELFNSITSDYLESKRVVLYGSSLGAYAAIYYSGVVGGQAVAFSPRCPADPILGLKKFQCEFNHYFLDSMPLAYLSELPPIIAYDPNVEIDDRFMRCRVLKAYPDAKVMEVPNGQHTIATTFKNSGVLKEFFFNSMKYGVIEVSRKVDPLCNPAYTAKAAKKYFKKGQFSDFNFNLLECFKWGFKHEAISLLDRAVEAEALDFRISANDVPFSMRKKYIERRAMEFELDEEVDMIKVASLHSELLDYDASLNLLYLGRSLSKDPKNNIYDKLINKNLRKKRYLDSLPLVKFS